MVTESTANKPATRAVTLLEDGLDAWSWFHDQRQPVPASVPRLKLLQALQHQAECDVSTALAAADIGFIWIKGVAVGQLVYPEPWLRPRGDADLWVAPEQRGCAIACLCQQLGYQVDSASQTAAGRLLRRRDGAMTHLLDVHDRALSRPQFARALDWQRALTDAVEHPELGRLLAGPSAMVLAALHLAAHHAHEPLQTLWLLDLDLLWRGLSTSQRRSAWQQLGDTEQQACFADLLSLSHARWQTPDTAAPEGVVVRQPKRPEGLLRRTLADLRATGDLHAGVKLAAQHLFPPADYLAHKYPGWLGRHRVFASAYRLLSGLPKLWR